MKMVKRTLQLNNELKTPSLRNSVKLNIRLLIVDDDQINILVLTRYLENNEEYKFDKAFNGKQAVDLVANKAEQGIFFDVILMDCNMPVMDGFQATAAINEMIKENTIKNVFIIASTANASQEDLKNCYQSGMVDVLFKPYGKNTLRNKLESFFEKIK